MCASKHVHLEGVCAYICAHPARRRACACTRNERVCASVAALSVCAREGQSESSGRACVVLGGGVGSVALDSVGRGSLRRCATVPRPRHVMGAAPLCTRGGVAPGGPTATPAQGGSPSVIQWSRCHTSHLECRTRVNSCVGVTCGAGSRCGRGWAWVWLLMAAGWAALLAPTCQANPDAKRLYDDLLSSYNRLIRPVGNNSDRLTVKLGLKLSQLIDVVSPALSALAHFRGRKTFRIRSRKSPSPPPTPPPAPPPP